MILRTKPLGEADLLVSFFTHREGKVVGVAPHARRSRRRFGGGLEPGTIGEIAYRERAGRELVGVEDLRIIAHLPAAVHALSRFAALGVILSVAEAMSMERQASPAKLQLLEATLGTLAQASPSQTISYFLRHWLRETGFDPNFDHCVRCARVFEAEEAGFFVPNEGGSLCHDCGRARGWAMPLSAAMRVGWQRLAEVTSAASAPLSEDLQNFCRVGLWTYVNHVIGRPLPSAPYWDMIWQQG